MMPSFIQWLINSTVAEVKPKAKPKAKPKRTKRTKGTKDGYNKR